MSGQNNNDGFQQAMLKTALETTPQLSEENYSIWKDKMTALLQLRGVLTTLNDEQTDAAALADDVNAELILLFIAKIDSVTHNNVVTADNRNSARALWKAIKDRFASDESSNRARVFNKSNKNNEGRSGQSGAGSNRGKRCTTGFHNPKQDDNHFSDSCWHLHPDKAPEWWREAQAKWQSNKNVNYYTSLVTLWTNDGGSKTKIVLDSGASAHIFNDVQFFSNLELRDLDVIRTGKKDATLPIKGMGKVTLQWGNSVLTLDNCLYVPNIVINLVSAGALIEKGCDINAGKGAFRVSKCNLLLFKGKIDNNLFTIDNPNAVGGTIKHSAHLSATLPESLKSIHE
ncbi:hypothetical protein PSTT_17014, partial [Puccinia striiformis]